MNEPKWSPGQQVGPLSPVRHSGVITRSFVPPNRSLVVPKDAFLTQRCRSLRLG